MSCPGLQPEDLLPTGSQCECCGLDKDAEGGMNGKMLTERDTLLLERACVSLARKNFKK